MDTCTVRDNTGIHEQPIRPDGELSHWLSVSGDLDDFIYYGNNEKEHSER